jgi:CheY-like chemotaxis protein
MSCELADLFPDLEVSILGSAQVRRQDGTWAKLPPLIGDMLAALALAGEAGRPKEWLLEALWSDDNRSDNAFAQAILKLRNHVTVPKPSAKGNYVLRVTGKRVDALLFCDRVKEVVARSEQSVAELDALLALWRDSPWSGRSRLRASAWADVRSARDKLVDVVRGLPDEQRSALTSWNRFCETFPSESAGWRSQDRLPGPPRKRVLVVDDKIASELIAAFGGGYDCDKVTSLVQWSAMIKGGHALDYDCALVDLHLKDSMTDAGGEIVLQDLKRLRPDIPTVLMSAELPFEDWHSIRERLGVSTVIAKHNDENKTVVPLYQTVAKLISEAGR